MPLTSLRGRSTIFLTLLYLRIATGDDVLEAVDLKAEFKEELCSVDARGICFGACQAVVLYISSDRWSFIHQAIPASAELA